MTGVPALSIALLVAQSLGRTHHSAHPPRRLVDDRTTGQLRAVGFELAERGGHAALQVEQERLSLIRVGVQDGERQLVEGGAEQHEGDSARRCFEAFVLFLHARPRRPTCDAGEVARGMTSANAADRDPLGAFATGLSASGRR